MFDPTVSYSPEQYYCSQGKLFSATSGLITLNATGGNVCYWVNPSDSGVELNLARMSLTQDLDGIWYRYRFNSLNKITIPSDLTSMPSICRNGSSATSKGKLYAASSRIVAALAQAVLETPIQVLGRMPFYVIESGSMSLKPGQMLSWNFVPKGGLGNGNANTAVENVWWEL